MAYMHTREHGSNKELEPLIATDALYSFWYAKYVLRDKFGLGERIITSNKDIRKQYINDVIDFDFEESDRIYNEALKKVNGRVDLL